MNKLFQIFLLSLFIPSLSAAGPLWRDQLIIPQTLEHRSLDDVIQTVHSGQVILMGENHTSEQDHINQRRLISALVQDGQAGPVSVGMEFIDYSKQEFVDQFVAGTMAEKDFLKNVGWGNNNFDFYRGLVLTPQFSGGKTYALNLPSAIDKKIFWNGFDSLSEDEKSKLPPDFQVGGELYKKRFLEIIKTQHGEVPPEMLDNMFLAQSAWDDTMAWKIAEAMSENPGQVLVVIVGGVHTEFNLAIPARLKARGITDILNIVQINPVGLSSVELLKYINPDPRFGPVANYVWVQ